MYLKGKPSNIVMLDIPVSSKINLFQLRLANHRYAIETGSWARPKILRESRTCIACGILEDEYHVILCCPLYSSLRINYLEAIYWDNPTADKYVELINSTCVKTMNNLAKLYSKIKELRTLLSLE